MNRRNSVCTIFHAMCLLVMGMLPVSTFADNPMVSREVKHDVSPPLRNLTPGQASTATDQQQLVARPTRPALANAQPDPVAQQLTAPLSGVSTGPNFDGQSANDNRNLLGFTFVPPDTNGAVGATQFVQIVNVTYAVYNKSTGAVELGPALINTIWAGFGGLCETENRGDPVVLYDHLAGRWLISQLAFSSGFTENFQCIAISTTSDATGTYNRYAFPF